MLQKDISRHLLSVVAAAVGVAFVGTGCFSASEDGDGPVVVDDAGDAGDDAVVITNGGAEDTGSYRLEDVGDVGDAPKIRVPPRLEFRRGGEFREETEGQTFTVANVGSAPLVVTDLSVESVGAQDAFYEAGEWPPTMRLLPGENKELAVAFSPEGPSEARGRVMFETNDPRYRGGTVPVPLHAPAAPCLEPAKDEYIFEVDNASAEGLVTKEIAFENCGGTEVEVVRTVIQEEFGRVFEFEEYHDVEIEADSSWSFPVTAHVRDIPPDLLPFSRDLYVDVSGATGEPIVVSLVIR